MEALTDYGNSSDEMHDVTSYTGIFLYRGV